jgi:hypothetical protein
MRGLRILPYIIAFFVAGCTLMWSCMARGEEAVDTDGAVPLAAGEEAPFDGILFPTELAIQMGFRIETLQARLRLDVEREQRLCRAQIDFEHRRLELEEERRDFQVDLLTQRVQEQAEELARPTPWYRRWGFAYGMGILTSVILVAGGVVALVSVM